MLKDQRRLVYFVLLCCLFFLGNSCNVINPTEPVPTYIHIDSFIFEKNPSVNLSTSHQITSVWVYYNNNNIGNFDLPCTIPIITSGTGMLQLAPAVANDGLNNIVYLYPFYTVDTFTLVPQPGKVVTHEPKTEYYSDVVVNHLTNFAFGITNFALVAGDRPVQAAYADSLQFEGLPTGEVKLLAVGDSSVDSCIDTLNIPSDGSEAYIEFNYKSTVPFAVGLSGTLTNLIYGSPFYLGGAYPSDQWQKFYLYVSQFTQKYPSTYYTFYLHVSLGAGQTSGRLLIANLQLITF